MYKPGNKIMFSILFELGKEHWVELKSQKWCFSEHHCSVDSFCRHCCSKRLALFALNTCHDHDDDVAEEEDGCNDEKVKGVAEMCLILRRPTVLQVAARQDVVAQVGGEQHRIQDDCDDAEASCNIEKVVIENNVNNLVKYYVIEPLVMRKGVTVALSLKIL